ncbi:MAG TPA: glycoside hydrolase family 28 protein [Rhizobium sp.]|nr:glycoside hydrolase family 28 protein [Rhizobium sp.]
MTRPFAVAISARIAAIRLPVPGALYHLPGPLAFRLTPVARPEEVLDGLTDRAVTLVDGLSPETGYRFQADGLESFEFRTKPCSGLVEATDFGLIEGTDLTDIDSARRNAEALAEALGAVPEGGTLRLGAGVWTALPLQLASGVTLHLAEGAVLRAPSLRIGWPILPPRDGAGHMLGSWEGLPDACFAAPLHAIGAERLTIEGAGLIDGSGDAGDWWTWPKERREGARRPRGLHLVRCHDVTLLGFTIRNAASWTVHPQDCNRLVVAGLSIEAPPDSPNTDGLNPECCREVAVEGVRFSVGDDCIAVKAGRRGPNGEAEHLSETRGLTVRHCRMERGHGGLVIGSEMSGGVHDVTIEDCEMLGTDRGLRLKTRRGRGGSISAITMRRVRMEHVLTAITANAHYYCDVDGHEPWVQSREPLPVGPGTPAIDDLTIEDIDIHHLAHAAGVFLGLPEAPIRGVRIRRLRLLSLAPEAVATPPVMADHVRPMRHEGIVAEHADVCCDDPALLSSASISMPAVRDAP